LTSRSLSSRATLSGPDPGGWDKIILMGLSGQAACACVHGDIGTVAAAKAWIKCLRCMFVSCCFKNM
jgi:hypothetical protein